MAASLGSSYKDNPKLDFKTALNVLRNTPQKVSGGAAQTIPGIFWNRSIDSAYDILLRNRLI